LTSGNLLRTLRLHRQRSFLEINTRHERRKRRRGIFGIAKYRAFLYAEEMDAKALLDHQQSLVAKLRRDFVEAQRKLEVAVVAEEAMRRMWEAMSGEVSAQKTMEPRPLNAGLSLERRGGGRQPGSITRQWRDALRTIYGKGRVPYSVIHDTYTKVTNTQITFSAVRDRVREMVRMGHMLGDAQTGFEVTESAAIRFEFVKDAEPTGSNEIEPLSRITASGPIGEGYQPSLYPNPA
jgi:hypothetical protein